ncbi:aminotransferase class V-fold PLP-dependent enzyme [Devosia sp. MC1541]|uniref:DegT/DnrJ/EryC1/StrS family aminotransferase n=1 Tax=Devosia sp. MC1541 TaxID=2725264 RepID=UPI00145CD9D8|nr:aminotransferase class V-fold PLP-dependent enzyme [Devosia sp. MC1541]
MAPHSSIQPFYGALPAEAQAAAGAVMASGQIAAGPLVQDFEAVVGAMVGREPAHVVAISDMTTALVMALHLAGVRPGDDVMTLAFSCMSSNSAAARVGANVIWVDLDPETATMSLDDLTRALTPHTRALMVYHVAGYLAPIEQIAEFCRAHDIVLIEDCNAALGAQDAHRRPAGSTGDFAVCSFYPNRLVNALEGAVLVCPDGAVAARARRLRRYGVNSKTFRDTRGEIDPASDVSEIGWAGSLSQLHAAVGLATATTAPARLTQVRRIADRLHEAAAGATSFRPVRPLAGALPSYWVFLLLAQDRDGLRQHLLDKGIRTTQLHQRNDVYSGFRAVQRDLPGTSRMMEQVLALPCGWWVGEDELDRMTGALSSASR